MPKLLSKQSFVTLARRVHGDFYNYSDTNYTSYKVKVTIKCPEHGAFSQEPSNHLQGKGCPGCVISGFNQTKPATLYALRSECGQYVKIGISNHCKERLVILKRKTPFDFSPVELIEGDGGTILILEKIFHNHFESASLTGFDGATEWLKWTPEIQQWLRLLK